MNKTTKVDGADTPPVKEKPAAATTAAVAPTPPNPAEGGSYIRRADGVLVRQPNEAPVKED